MTRVSVPPEMLLWACERAGYDVAHLAVRIPQLPAWVPSRKAADAQAVGEVNRA